MISCGTRLLVESQCFSFCLMDRVVFLSYTIANKFTVGKTVH